MREREPRALAGWPSRLLFLSPYACSIISCLYHERSVLVMVSGDAQKQWEGY